MLGPVKTLLPNKKPCASRNNMHTVLMVKGLLRNEVSLRESLITLIA